MLESSSLLQDAVVQAIIAANKIDVEGAEDNLKQIQKEFPTKIKAVYIHQVQGNKSLPGIKYHTAFDIMVSEYKAGRMSSIAVLDMAKDFMFFKDLSLVFPKFKYCPTQISSFNTELPFIVREASKGVYNRIIKYCNERF